MPVFHLAIGRMECGKQGWVDASSEVTVVQSTWVETAAGHTHPALRAAFPSQSWEGKPAVRVRRQFLPRTEI